jgi:hypothetical protein
METKYVISPRDVYELVDGNNLLVVRKGDKITEQQAIKHKILPIVVSSAFYLESK